MALIQKLYRYAKVRMTWRCADDGTHLVNMSDNPTMLCMECTTCGRSWSWAAK